MVLGGEGQGWPLGVGWVTTQSWVECRVLELGVDSVVLQLSKKRIGEERCERRFKSSGDSGAVRAEGGAQHPPGFRTACAIDWQAHGDVEPKADTSTKWEADIYT